MKDDEILGKKKINRKEDEKRIRYLKVKLDEDKMKEEQEFKGSIEKEKEVLRILIKLNIDVEDDEESKGEEKIIKGEQKKDKED